MGADEASGAIIASGESGAAPESVAERGTPASWQLFGDVEFVEFPLDRSTEPGEVDIKLEGRE